MPVKELVDRFYRELAPNATYDDSMAVFIEEVAEAREAALDVPRVCSPLCQCDDAREVRGHLAKELGDLVFTAYGLALMAGIDLDEAAYIVANDNLKNKVRAEAGKVQRRGGYRPPSLWPALVESRHGFEVAH